MDSFEETRWHSGTHLPQMMLASSQLLTELGTKVHKFTREGGKSKNLISLFDCLVLNNLN